MDAFTTQQTAELVSRIGCKKAHMRLDKLWWNAFMAGPLLGFGCAICTSTNSSPWYQENAPGLIRTISAAFFPIGLVMIVLSGADLFTSNIMFMTTAFLHRRVSIKDVAINWVVSYFGNLAGMLFFMAIIIGYGGVFSEAPYKAETVSFAVMKAQEPAWHQIFLRAIGANWLVCFAVFISISSREIVSKIVAIWWPTATFVALAFDHVVANMFFVPIGIWNGTPFGVGYYIWKSLIPATIGNMVGGGLFVGAAYWYLYLTGEGAVGIDFNTGGLNSAMEVGGPMGRYHTKGQDGKTHANGDSDGVIEGRDPDGDQNHMANQLPHSGSYMTSGISKELSPEIYAKRKGEPLEKEGLPRDNTV
ncbi:MAG: hypothetical protein M1827_002024 [Pycnora praestabilis]|nr:MAG: hypothetical protein M1827_002024 [Pycnora praestabilis]